MTKSHSYQLIQSVKELREFGFSQLSSINLWRLSGYVLLGLTFFDLVEKLIPLQLMNPVWEFQTMGELVERVPIPLLGLGLVFYGGKYRRVRGELLLLKFLSWLAWGFGVMFWLFIPLGISSTVRIERQNQKQIVPQVDQPIAEILPVEEAIDKTKTPAEMEALISRLARQGLSPNIQTAQQLEELKKQLLDSSDQGEEKMLEQAEETLSQNRLGLWKSSVKWNLGALVSGVLFIKIWRGTRWARRSIKKNPSKS